jgi:YaiO family outer membrane protein
MEKFKSLLSFALGLCLTSTTFKVLSNSMDMEVNSKPQPSVATNATPSDITPPVSIVISEKTVDKKSSYPVSEAAEAKKNWDKAINTYKESAAETEKNWADVISIYRGEIAKDPNRPDLWQKIADIENQRQHYQDAIEALKNAIKLQPHNADLYVSLSETYTCTNQSKEALAAIQQALKIDPMNLDYLNKSILLANWAEEYNEAEDGYKRILKLQPDNQRARVGLENIESKIAKSQNTSIAKTKSPISEAMTVETADKRSPETAIVTPISEVMTAEAVNKKTPEATVITPVSIAISEETVPVTTPVSIAMSEETTNKKSLESVAETVEAEKNYKAIRTYKEEIAKDPNRPDLWKKIADIENQQQHYQNAIEALKNAIKLQPKNTELYVSLSETYVAANQPQEALLAINQTLQVEPVNIDYLNRRGILAIWAEEYDQAEDSYKRILNIEPNNQVARIGLNIEAERVAKLNTRPPTVEEKPPVSAAMEAKAPLLKPTGSVVGPKTAKLKTFPSIKTLSTNNILSATPNPVLPLHGYIEGGRAYNHLTDGNGNWHNQYIKSVLQTDSKNTWLGEIDYDNEFGEKALYGVVENTHTINDLWFSTVGFGLSNRSTYVPKYYAGAQISRKFLKQQQLVAYLGGHSYWWRPSPITTQELNPGLAYNFESPWVLEGGAYISRFMPGAIYSKSYYVAITQGKEKEHFFTLRYGFGREAYQATAVNLPDLINYPSTVATVTWRQWIEKKWGFTLGAEIYQNTFYKRYGITFGIFRDIGL